MVRVHVGGPIGTLICELPYRVKPGGRGTKPCSAGLPFPLGKWNMTAEGRRKRRTTRQGTEDSGSVSGLGVEARDISLAHGD